MQIMFLFEKTLKQMLCGPWTVISSISTRRGINLLGVQCTLCIENRYQTDFALKNVLGRGDCSLQGTLGRIVQALRCLRFIAASPEFDFTVSQIFENVLSIILKHPFRN